MTKKIPYFHYKIPTQICFGEGILAEMPETILKFSDNVLFLTMKDLPGKNQVISKLEDNGFKLTVFEDIEPNPSTTTVERAADLARKKSCRVIVALGGG